MEPHDGSDACHVLLLATTPGEHVCRFSPLLSAISQSLLFSMPPVTRVQAKKQVLAGPMRIIPEGTAGAWPGDNQNQCSQGYNCGNPSLAIDPFVPFGNRFVDVSAGGPTPFSWTAKSNSAWVKLSSAGGDISPSNPEQRVFLSIDWSQVTGSQSAVITFTAKAQGQPTLNVPVTLAASNRAPPSDFHGTSRSFKRPII